MTQNTAKLYDYRSNLIAHCTNTPQAIAKAAMEHTEVRFYIGAPQRTAMRHIGAVRPHMTSANNADSGYVAVAGVVPVIDTFDPLDIIDN